MQKLSKVKAGTSIGSGYKVAKSCKQNSSHGRWYCVTHEEMFQHNFAKDLHIHNGKHELAWWCPKDVAFEVP